MQRTEPYALRRKVEVELDMLYRNGFEISYQWLGFTKTAKTIQFRVNYKLVVNYLPVNVNYPIKRIQEVLHNLRHSLFICSFNLFKAYLHFDVDEVSIEIQTISTHRITFKIHRSSLGIKTAPADFNRVIDRILVYT